MIGPRCTKCKKQKYHHRLRDFACPTDKKIQGSYTAFHETEKFTPKEPVKRNSSEKRKDRSVRREIKSGHCVACGMAGSDYNPIDPCHVRSWKISQCDEPWNMIPMCRAHHNGQERMGWLRMNQLYLGVATALKERGWEFTVNESTGDWSMWNPKEVEWNKRRRAV